MPKYQVGQKLCQTQTGRKFVIDKIIEFQSGYAGYELHPLDSDWPTRLRQFEGEVDRFFEVVSEN